MSIQNFHLKINKIWREREKEEIKKFTGTVLIKKSDKNMTIQKLQDIKKERKNYA